MHDYGDCFNLLWISVFRTTDTLKKTSSETAAYSQISEAFQSIINKYGGNAAGKLARVMYANISYDAQQYEKAIALYKQSLNDFKDDKLVYNMVLSNLGHAYQRIEDEQNAAAYFEKAASATDSPIREDAQKMLQEILKNHPDSIYFDLVEEELNALNK
jgi:tetratricopeptide (TPR) repeat protein